RLDGCNIILSTNVPVRKDGLFYASAKAPDDPGVAVYFDYQDRQHCFACDEWDRLRDNVQGIRKTIEALRGIARWGSGDMMQQAFTGFSALPDRESAAQRHWAEVLGVSSTASKSEIIEAYRRARRCAHPDSGGSAKQFHRVQQAW